MFKLKKLGILSGTLVSFALLIHGCGGGGSSSTPTSTTGTATKSATAASKAVVSALGTATLGTGTGVPTKPVLKAKAGSNQSDMVQVRQALQAFKASLGARQQKALQTVTDTGDQPCNGGGTRRSVANDNNTPTDVTDDSLTLTATNCTNNLGPDLTIFTNGSFSLAPTTGGFTITFTNFVSRTTTPSDVVESASNGTMAFSGTEVACGTTSFLESGTFTMNFTGAFKEDLDKNGSFEFNESFTVDNLTMTIAEAHSAAPACTPGPATFTMNGAISFTDQVNAENNLSATFTNFQMVLTPAVRNSVNGDTLSLSGTIAISSSCANGTFTISTPTGEEPFVPADDSCPVSGKFLVTGGGSTTAVKFTSTGGVEIDEGNDGSNEKTFTTCDEAEVCT